MFALPPTTDPDGIYELTVIVGKQTETVTFTLGTTEFKQIVITLP